MSDNSWTARERPRDPFAPEGAQSDGYEPWSTNASGWVRDLKFVLPIGTPVRWRYEGYMQTISMELNAAATELCMMCHTSGQLIVIEGRELSELADLISAKRIQLVTVWSEPEHGPMPPRVVTAVQFDKTFVTQRAT